MSFASRTDAGQRLGRFLAEQKTRADLVLGLPRGGVIEAKLHLHWRLAACKIDGRRRKAAFGRLCCFWGVALHPLHRRSRIIE